MSETETGSVTEGTEGAGTEAVTSAGNPGSGAEPEGFDWKGALGDAYGKHEKVIQAKGWKSPAEALESYQGLEAMIGGGDRVKIPGEDAKPEDWDKFYSKLGRPENPDGYEFTKPEGFDGYSDDFAGKAREAFHKAGLTDGQAKALHDWWVGEFQGASQATEEARTQYKATLEADMAKNWGAEKGQKLDAAKRAATSLGLDAERLLEVEGAAGGFRMMDTLARIGAGLREDTIAGGAGSGATAEAARGDLANLMADGEFNKALHDKSHPGHREAVDRWTRLNAAANPTATARLPK